MHSLLDHCQSPQNFLSFELVLSKSTTLYPGTSLKVGSGPVNLSAFVYIHIYIYIMYMLILSAQICLPHGLSSRVKAKTTDGHRMDGWLALIVVKSRVLIPNSHLR